MHLKRLLVLGSVALGICGAQDHSPKPKVSNDPLTTEQISVYRAVLENYVKDSPGSLNLAVRTEPLEQSEPFFDKACVRELELESAANAIPVIHTLTAAVAPSSAKIVLVDPARQQKKVNENDPQKVVNKAIEGREKVTKKELDASVERAFSTGLFTLSEVVFDKQHSHAVVAYSFVCGGLCGHGSTLILTKVGQNWKVSKPCGGWIS
jgi:hypothetical protein